MLDFSTKYCGWCGKAAPILEDIYSEKNEKLEVITFYVDDDKEGFQEFCGNKTWNSVMDEKGRFGKTYVSYDGGVTPSFFLFDKEGTLVKEWKGLSDDFKEELEGIIQ